MNFETKMALFIKKIVIVYLHSYMLGAQDDYDAHIISKDEARQEKTKDKESGNNTISVWSMDLQAVLLCPRTKASAK